MSIKEKLDIVFKRKNREVTIDEMEKGLTEDINEILDDMASRKVTFFKSIITQIDEFKRYFLIALIVCTPLAIFLSFAVGNLVAKVTLIIYIMLVFLFAVTILLDIKSVYKDLARLREYIKKAREEESLTRKFTLLCDAEDIACEFKEFTDLSDFKFNVVEDFLDLREVAKQEILEHSLSSKSTNIAIKTADENGTVQTTIITPDEKRENTKVTNDVLICSDEGTTFIKAFKK